MNSVTINVEFQVTSDTAWLIDILKNDNMRDDLAQRAMFEFRKDLCKMYGFGPSYVTTKLKGTSAI